VALSNPRWDEVFASLGPKYPPYLYSDFVAAMQGFEESGDQDAAHEARILAQASSFLMSQDATRFDPMMAGPTGRTVLPEDFDNSKLETVRAAIARGVPSPLEARLRDIVWVSTRHNSDAVAAAAAYLTAAGELHLTESWPIPVKYLRRGFLIASSARDDDLRNRAVAVARGWLAECVASSDEGHAASGILQSLADWKVVGPDDLATALAFAQRALDRGDSHVHRSYLEVAQRVANRIGNDEAAKSARLAVAEAWNRDAESASVAGDNLRAVFFFDEAVKAYRLVGGATATVEAVLARQLECQSLATDEMQVIEFTLEDASIGKVIEAARAAVAGQSELDAVRALVRQAVPTVQGLIDYAAAATGLTDLFQKLTFDDRSRIVGRSTGELDGEDKTERSSLVSAGITMHSFIDCTWIRPALAVMREEHPCIAASAMLPLLADNPLVPAGRAKAFARAIELGLTGDMATAMPKLMGEFENGVREYLRSGGVPVTRMDQYGIQRERDLNELLYEQALVDALGEDVAMDLQTTLVDNSGSNVRNRIAHGLVSPEQFEASDISYAFWLVLKVLVSRS
jgi:hypothetical protein